MWNELPVQVECMRQGAWGWCTGMTQRDGMGREVGGGFRMYMCTPVVDSCWCIAKPIQYCKVKIIIKFKKKSLTLCLYKYKLVSLHMYSWHHFFLTFLIFLSSMVHLRVFQIAINLQKFFQHIYWKKSTCKWTLAVQTCIVQGSTILETFTDSLPYNF